MAFPSWTFSFDHRCGGRSRRWSPRFYVDCRRARLRRNVASVGALQLRVGRFSVRRTSRWDSGSASAISSASTASASGCSGHRLPDAACAPGSSLESVHKKTQAFCMVRPLARERDDGRFRLARPVPVLRVLGRHADFDVFPDPHLGISPYYAADRVPPLHDGRQRPDARWPSWRLRYLHYLCDRMYTGFSTCSVSTSPQIRRPLQFWGFPRLRAGVRDRSAALSCSFNTRWLPDAHVEAPTAGSVIPLGCWWRCVPMASSVLRFRCFRRLLLAPISRFLLSSASWHARCGDVACSRT